MNLIEKNKKEKSYFKWIANLGVVPLFLLAAFLLCPAFFNLFALFVLVFLVNETMNFTLILISLYQKYLSFLPAFVKKSNLCTIAVSLTVCNYSYSNTTPIIIALGEQTEIPQKVVEKFSVGNPDIVGQRYLESERKLLIKGKKMGFSDLIIWGGGRKTKYSVYVLAKRRHLELIGHLERLKGIGLLVTPMGPYLKIEGVLKNLTQVKILGNLYKENSEKFEINVQYTPKLKKKILENIVLEFFREQISPVKCDFENIQIFCFYPEGLAPSKGLKDLLSRRFPITFLEDKKNRQLENYKIKIKVIQIERLDGKEISFGIEKIGGSLKTLFKKGLSSLIDFNPFLFQEKNLTLSTIAEPEIITQIGKPSIVELGSKIAFKGQKNDNGKSLHWVFAGIKNEILLTAVSNSVQVKYHTEFTYPNFTSSNEKKISGSKESSTLSLPFNKPIKIFSISYKSLGTNEEGIPYLKNIPIIGKLFVSSNESSNFKKIEGFVMIQRQKL
ncbi:MAG: hypothetical protein HOE90_25055 [Bacteriovoracaceae bacterium]|jgi:hypothetical protein|nr:hypothetical protein [Bacteriovoracaceae bacterium]